MRTPPFWRKSPFTHCVRSKNVGLFASSPMRISIFSKKRKTPDEEFIEAHDTYARNILRHIYIRVSNRSSAEDILSETFLKTWQFLQRGGDVKNFKSFLYKVASNLIIDYYRRKPSAPVSLEDLSKEPVADIMSAEDILDRKFSYVFLRNSLKKLPLKYREIIMYRYIDELSIKEIKQITGKSVANIYVILHRGLKLLKSDLKEKRYDKKK